MNTSTLSSANWAAMLGYATSKTVSEMRSDGWEIAQIRQLPNEDVSIFWAVDLYKGDEFASLVVLDDPAVQELAETYGHVPLLDAA